MQRIIKAINELYDALEENASSEDTSEVDSLCHAISKSFMGSEEGVGAAS